MKISKILMGGKFSETMIIHKKIYHKIGCKDDETLKENSILNP